MLSNTDDDSDAVDDDDDQAYQDFLSRTIESSDADDEDFVHDVNGVDISSSSDTDSQSSIATENMSNDEIDMNRSVEVSIQTWYKMRHNLCVACWNSRKLLPTLKRW